ncbi:MAG: histidine kinase [Desulfomicrobium sp.]|nr:histidine kinase [Pseudomonadota bacterium]MBV1748825.1 histidine kinase [Desulfomicrobium sp.]
MNMHADKTKRTRINPWLVAGLTVILGLAVSVFAVRNVQREKEHMVQNYLEHAEALFWALEAGTRIGMGMHGSAGYFQSLVEETAKQHGIVYLAVTDAKGLVLAHSDAARVGSVLHPPEAMSARSLSEERQGHFQDTEDRRVFEVYKKFAPLPGVHHSMWCPPRNGGMAVMGMMQSRVQGEDNHDPSVIFLGLDVSPLEEAVAGELRTSVLIAVLVLLMGLGGFASLFWAQHYRLSRRQLRDTQAFASEVVRCLPLGLLSTDPDGRVVLSNGAASALLGLDKDAMPGMLLEGLGGVDWNGIMAGLADKGTVLEREVTLVAGPGKRVPVNLGASRIVTSDDDFLGYLFLLRDLGEIRRLQEQVRRNERLTALGNLAAGVAHEIRNPLSSIKGFATYLAGKVQGQDKDAARAMIQETDRLNRVVSELLEFARPGEMNLRDEDLAQVVERALRLVRADVTAKGVAVRFEQEGTLPRVPLDPERLTQALLNLFLNAVQAMDQGGTLRITAAPENEAGGVVLRIADTGHGMAAELVPDIFNPYFTTKSSGTGLGLAIVHRIIEAHGGEIKVDSVVGQGTVFTLLLPSTGRRS